jgi:hypothetical protein
LRDAGHQLPECDRCRALGDLCIAHAFAARPKTDNIALDYLGKVIGCAECGDPMRWVSPGGNLPRFLAHMIPVRGHVARMPS